MVPMTCTIPALAASFASATVASGIGEVDDAVGIGRARVSASSVIGAVLAAEAGKSRIACDRSAASRPLQARRTA